MQDERFRYYAFWLCGICIAVFALQYLTSGFTELFVLNQNHAEIWRFLSAIFLHSGVVHLLYNLFALALFGSILEAIIGGRKFLLVFFASGIIANILSVFFYPSSLGASGAIFGIIGTLVVLRPGMSVWAFSLPMPLVLAAGLWVAGDMLGAYGYLSGNPIDNTGNIAHLAGMVIGLVFGFFWRKNEPKTKSERLKINEEYMRDWEDSYLR